ncbi:ABC transporter permease [Virgibacillus indicus]|nr:ABC transporter permease [Virgibacillus indicus]
MMNVLKTRLIHWRKQVFPLLFWLLLPIIAVILLIQAANAIQADSKVPVGLVVEENTQFAKDLAASIKQTPFIRVYETTEEDAKLKLEQHELDSAFVIKEGYEDNVRKGSRNRLVTSYKSDLSFAYTPVSEMIISYVQQDTGRSKAAHTVKALSDNYSPDQQWSWEEVVTKSKEVEAEESLLHTTFTFADSAKEDEENEITILNTWGLWAVFSILSTLLLFDWVIRENRKSLIPRFTFIRFSYKNYFVLNTLLYTILLFLFDLAAVISFNLFLNEPFAMNIWVLLTYRLMLNAGAFLLALCFNNIYLFYSASFALTLFFGILSGAVIPIEGLTQRFQWLEYVNPLDAFLSGRNSSLWLAVLLFIFALWYVRKEKSDASH